MKGATPPSNTTRGEAVYLAIVNKSTSNQNAFSKSHKGPSNRHNKQYKAKPSKEVSTPLNGQETASNEAQAVQAIQN